MGRKKRKSRLKPRSENSVTQPRPAPEPGPGHLLPEGSAQLEARRARERARAVALRDPPPSAEPAVAAVESLEDARKRKEAQGQGELEIPLSELHAYKLLHLEDVLRRTQQAVKQPLQQAAQRALDAEIQALTNRRRAELGQRVAEALQQSEDVRKARADYHAAANAVIDEVTPGLPAGYAVAEIQPEPDKRRVVARHNPELRGKRFQEG